MRFYQHHGFDWHAMQIAAGDEYGRRAHTRRVHPYAATDKNLVLRNRRSILRKGAEFTLVPVAEVVLGKQRILELYLNEVEWGPGVYGAEAAFAITTTEPQPEYSTGNKGRDSLQFCRCP